MSETAYKSDRDPNYVSKSADSLRQIFLDHEGYLSDKWEHYLPIYESALAGFIAGGRPVRLLEIGVQNGGSIQIWSKYLPQGSTIVGIDTDKACADLLVESHVSVRSGDASDPVALDRMLGDARFDVIIDDGSHRSEHIIASFEACFSRLDRNGLYIVEDLHCSYFASHGGGLRRPGAAMEWFKGLADALNIDHFEGDAFEKLDTVELHRLRDLGRQIAWICFFDSVVLIQKLAREKRRPFRRIMTGREARVVDIASQIALLATSQLRTLLLPPSAAAAFTPPLLNALAVAKEEGEAAERERVVWQQQATEAKREAAEWHRRAAAVELAEMARARTEAELTRLRSEHEGLLSSTTWKATWPLRRLGAVMPPYLRAVVRRGAKIAWWSITLQLPAKLRQRGAFRDFGAGSPEPAPAAADYAEWIRRYDTLDDDDRRAIAAAAARMTDPPLISVLMPVYETPPHCLRAAIESVRAQLYSHWELCIADDASQSPEVRNVIEHYRALDRRIKVCYRSTNGHISAATNSALELAEGRFVALLDHDDVLPEHALFEVATVIAQDPEIDLIYTDEDKIDDNGRRFEPYFKSDWNPDLLLSQNMFNHLGIYRRSLVKEVGGFRQGYEGSQDYDLVLRASALTTPERIHHIPRILYHWRAVAGSVASSPQEKDYAVINARRAIADHLRERGIEAEVGPGLCPNFHRVRYLLPEPAAKVSIIIPTRDRIDLLKKCIEGIFCRTNYTNLEVLIIDNQSRELATLAYLTELSADPRVRILRYEKSFNYSAINNFAASVANGTLLCLLNNDIEVIAPGWLTEMASHAMRSGIGAVGAMLYYPDDTIQHAGVIAGIGGVAGHAHHGLPRGDLGYFGRAALVQNLSAVTAACLVMPKALYHRLGGLNETELAVAFNDVDLCLRIREAGYRIVWTPHAQLYHHESASRGPDTDHDKIERFRAEVAYMMRRWGHLLDRDPYYNPNLQLDSADFGLAFPPRITKPWLVKLEPGDMAPVGAWSYPLPNQGLR